MIVILHRWLDELLRPLRLYTPAWPSCQHVTLSDIRASTFLLPFQGAE